jgi:hypothetical protein
VALANVVAIAAGYHHNLALKEDGEVVAWGGNTSGQTNVPPGLANVVAISAGQIHNLALRLDGTIVGWGNNYAGLATPPADLTNAIAIACGGGHNLTLTADGTVVAWGGDNLSGQTNVPPFVTNVVAISAGAGHSLALLGDDRPVLRARLSNPTKGANGFSVFLPTRSGRVYRLEYKNSLTDAQWTAMPLVAGNGGTSTLSDPTAPNTQRFYRVRQW